MFVSNGVSKIHEGSSAGRWRHVDTKQNTADHASHGLDAAEMAGFHVERRVRVAGRTNCTPRPSER
jgi:hypothetical protein